jgi:chromosome segregation ATPase
MNAPDQATFVEGMRAAIKEVLAEREEANQLDKVEELLSRAESTINELSETITAKDEELAAVSTVTEGLKAQIEELKAKAVELEEKLAEADKKAEEREGRAVAAEEKLASIEADKKLTVRMEELAEAKVVKAEDKREAQKERVRAMSDEDFIAYKEELVEMRNEVEAELRAAAATDEGQTTEGVTVPPADLDKARREDAAAAAAATLNIEVVSEDVKSMYHEMAAAMAKSLTAGRE